MLPLDRATLDALGAPVVVLDPRGRMVQANRALEEATGLVEADWAGRAVWDVFELEDSAKAVQQMLADVMARNFPNSYLLTFRTRTGRVLRSTWTNSALFDDAGEVAYVIGTASMVPEESDSSSRLLESEARFEAVARNTVDLISELDPDGRFVFASPNHATILGYAPEDLLGKDILPLLHPSDASAAPAVLARVGEGDARRLGRFRCRHADGGWRWLESSATSYETLGGSSHVVVVSRDVTESLAAERRAREAEQLASVGTLAAGLAHDVGTPMNVILGYAEMMQRSLADPRERKRAELIAEQVRRVAELIQTLLKVARPGELQPVRVDLEQTLGSSIDFYREKLRKHGIEVKRRFATVPIVQGDPDRLQRVFLNLIGNAADAMKEGGGALEIGLAPRGEEHVEIRVRDQGCGIPEEELPRIFEPFYTTKGRDRGTGLGLLTTKSIVVDHGGTIDVESRPGVGTEFRLLLPVAGPTDAADEPTPSD